MFKTAAKSNERKPSTKSSNEKTKKDTAPAVEAQTFTSQGCLKTVVGDIEEFQPIPEEIPMHPTIAAWGKRRTGKSTTFMNYAFHLMQDIPFGIVMSNTAFAGYWTQFVPRQFIFQGLREDILLKLVARQKALINEDEQALNDPKNAAFIILDDVIADQKAIRWGVDLNSFFVEGRHLGITVLIASQYMKGF